jgi:hypothetical protein
MDTNLVSMAQQFEGLPMEALIGGPLNAAATANSAMALSQTKFMLDTCFSTETTDGGGINYKPIMIVMQLERGVLTPGATAEEATKIEMVTTSFNLPLLTIVPLNSLAVDNVDVSFEMEVKSSFSEEQSQETQEKIAAESSFEAKVGWGPLSVSITGSASYDKQDSSSHNTHYEKSNSAKYTVGVHAGQLPLPNGVNVIIEAFTKAIEPIQMPTTPTT